MGGKDWACLPDLNDTEQLSVSSHSSSSSSSASSVSLVRVRFLSDCNSSSVVASGSWSASGSSFCSCSSSSCTRSNWSQVSPISISIVMLSFLLVPFTKLRGEGGVERGSSTVGGAETPETLLYCHSFSLYCCSLLPLLLLFFFPLTTSSSWVSMVRVTAGVGTARGPLRASTRLTSSYPGGTPSVWASAARAGCVAECLDLARARICRRAQNGARQIGHLLA